jgi:hypothetical protein
MPHLPPPPLLSRARFLAVLITLVAFLGITRSVSAYTLNAQEAALADLLVHDPGQTRGPMTLDPILSQVARERAADMANRGYFGHVNPDGQGPNALVAAAGYVLPAWWGNSPTDNFIESIAAGRSVAADTWADLMASTPHRTHLLAIDSFYRNQTSYGVGYATSPGNYRYYWVIITAPPNTLTGNAAQYVSQSVPGTMVNGQGYGVSVTMLNTGSNTWTQSAGYQLISLNPQDSMRWGLSRVSLPNSVAPGDSVTFNFTVVAPGYGGWSAFQWQMFKEGTGAFGEQTPFVNVLGYTPAPPAPPAPAYVAPSSSSSSSSSSSKSKSKSKKKKKKETKKKKSKSKSKKKK